MQMIATSVGQRPAYSINEDLIRIHGNTIVVMDGATSISGRKVVVLGQAHTDASWFVLRAAEHLLSSGDSQNIPACLKQAMQLADSEGASIWPDWHDGDLPSASICVAQFLDQMVEIFNLGDCICLYGDKKGVTTRLGSCDVAALDVALLGEYRRVRAEKSLSHEDAWKEILPLLRENRKRKNRANGYWILDPTATGLPYIQRFSVKSEPGSGLVICTDGLFRLVDSYGVMCQDEFYRTAVSPGGVDKLIGILDEIEVNDCRGLVYPRVKLRDDASAVTCLF